MVWEQFPRNLQADLIAEAKRLAQMEMTPAELQAAAQRSDALARRVKAYHSPSGQGEELSVPDAKMGLTGGSDGTESVRTTPSSVRKPNGFVSAIRALGESMRTHGRLRKVK